MSALRFVNSYLKNRMQRTKIIIMENIEITSYADDNTPYTTANSTEEVIQNLENAAKSLFQWFRDNQMKANDDKCHF